MTPAERNRKWARTAFEGGVSEVLQSGNGGRNVTLHRVTCRALEIANTVAAEVSRSEVRDRLLEAAQAAGLTRREAVTTMRSAHRTVGDATIYSKLPCPRDVDPDAPARPQPINVSAIFGGPSGEKHQIRERPPADELHAVWDMAQPCPPDVLANLSGKPRPGLDAERAAALRLVRLLPEGARMPRWASWWPRTGHRVLVPVYDATGALVSLWARAVDKPRGDMPKEFSPKGYAVGAAVPACPIGRDLLREDPFTLGYVREAGVVLVEGTPAWLAWAAGWQRSGLFDSAPACFAYCQGAWSRGHADRIPDGARVLIDADHDEAGQRMKRRIAQTFGDREINVQTTRKGAA